MSLKNCSRTTTKSLTSLKKLKNYIKMTRKCFLLNQTYEINKLKIFSECLFQTNYCF